jgi:photosystem II stability/assembly factor-like uncharacterized protein
MVHLFHYLIQSSGTVFILNDLDFVDETSGWAVGGSGTIVHTTDGGGTWTTQNSDTPYVLNGVDFMDANNGWAVGNEQPWGDVRMHTTDGGETWSQDSPYFAMWLDGVTFVDVNHGWIIGNTAFGDFELGVIPHTTDGGQTWTIQWGPGFLFGVDFVDASNGWAAGGDWYYDQSNSVIEHTTDGEAWTTQTGGTPSVLYDVDFADLNTGWAVGENGTVVHTTDGGETWTAQTSGSEYRLLGVTFVDADHGWCVGDSGMILRYDPTLKAPDEHSNLKPTSFSLSTFPNPFNPTTTIAYDLPKSGHISLRVFDLLGREVIVLKNGMMEAGSHRATFDGSRLASGIYFARLEAAEFSQTRKLMLLK